MPRFACSVIVAEGLRPLHSTVTISQDQIKRIVSMGAWRFATNAQAPVAMCVFDTTGRAW